MPRPWASLPIAPCLVIPRGIAIAPNQEGCGATPTNRAFHLNFIPIHHGSRSPKKSEVQILTQLPLLGKSNKTNVDSWFTSHVGLLVSANKRPQKSWKPKSLAQFINVCGVIATPVEAIVSCGAQFASSEVKDCPITTKESPPTKN